MHSPCVGSGLLGLASGLVLVALALRVELHHEVELTRGRFHDAGMPRLAPVPVDLHALPDPGCPCWWRHLWARRRWARRCWARGDRLAVGPAEAAPNRRALRHFRLLRSGGRVGRRRPAFPARLAARAVGVDVVTHLSALAGGRRAQEVRAEPRRIELRAVRSQLRNAASPCEASGSGSGRPPIAQRSPLGGRGRSRGARRLALGRGRAAFRWCRRWRWR